jgi:alpha-aminoadipic semialdehyde synthase
MEKRVAIVPSHVNELVQAGIQVKIEEPPKRIFTKDEYRDAGAEIVDDVSSCGLVFGVKEMPMDFFRKNGSYVFFSHVIKGQSYNMPMLRKMMELKCNLIDYEKIADADGKRLIFFGRFAGLAGMINSLWTIGQRLEKQGIATPFMKIRQSHTYNSLEEAKAAVSEVGSDIARDGLPKELLPFTVGVTGYGNVSRGAQEILHLLPVQEISPEQLKELKEKEDVPSNIVYKVVFEEKYLSERIDGSAFVLQDYFTSPSFSVVFLSNTYRISAS